jgi:hypothetical protein
MGDGRLEYSEYLPEFRFCSKIHIPDAAFSDKDVLGFELDKDDSLI